MENLLKIDGISLKLGQRFGNSFVKEIQQFCDEKKLKLDFTDDEFNADSAKTAKEVFYNWLMQVNANVLFNVWDEWGTAQNPLCR